jgi:hypothetical protein
MPPAVAAAAANARRQAAERARQAELEAEAQRRAAEAAYNAAREEVLAKSKLEGRSSMAGLVELLKLQKKYEDMGPSFSLTDKREVDGIEKLELDEPPELVVGPSGWTYHDRSLCCLRPADVPRRLAIYFVEWRWFDPIILVTILCNCSSMAWESPLDP